MSKWKWYLVLHKDYYVLPCGKLAKKPAKQGGSPQSQGCRRCVAAIVSVPELLYTCTCSGYEHWTFKSGLDSCSTPHLFSLSLSLSLSPPLSPSEIKIHGSFIVNPVPQRQQSIHIEACIYITAVLQVLINYVHLLTLCTCASRLRYLVCVCACVSVCYHPSGNGFHSLIQTKVS